MAVIKSSGYSIVIGKTAFAATNAFLKKNNYDAYFILCDEHTLHACLPLLITSCPALAAAEIIEIESGEDSKSLEVSAQILQTLIDNQAGKNALFINLGGGVVSDLGGFTASIYKRGMDVITIPTSLLAMADASVGGKTGIDFAGIKNSVGTFSQPKAVFINPVFLNTLPARHYKNGLAEIYKIALVGDAHLWHSLKDAANIKKPEALVTKSVQLKNNIVLKDPFDKGLRKSLNFGHTIGHALEALLLNTKEELLHGEAIVIGMLMESHIAFQKKLITKTLLSEITEQLLAVFELKPVSLLSFEAIIEAIQQDKKRSSNKMLFSLLRAIGVCALDVEVTRAHIKKAIDHYNQLA
jgi:3-dehydroquinate synthase